MMSLEIEHTTRFKCHPKNISDRNNPIIEDEDDQAQMNPLKNPKLSPLIEPIPVHVVSAYQMKRYIKSKDNKLKLLNALNYFREI